MIDLRKTQYEFGYSVIDLLKSIVDALTTIEFPSKTVLIYLLDALGQLEVQVAAGGHDAVYASTLIGHFQIARALTS